MRDSSLDPSEPEITSPSPAKEPLPELTLGRSRPSPPSAPRSERASRQDELEALASRCRARSEAARWAAECQREIQDRFNRPGDDQPPDEFVRLWAERITDAYYWSCSNAADTSGDPSSLDGLGGCLEALASGLLLLSNQPPNGPRIEKSLPLVAEAQAALRRAWRVLGLNDDQDQLEAYERVRELAAQHRIFMKRFMRSDDLADPASWPDLLSRIEALSGESSTSRRQKLLLDTLQAQCTTFQGVITESAAHDIMTTIESLVTAGTPPSSVDIRRPLIPVIDRFPDRDALSPAFRLVLREIDHFLATRSGGNPDTAPPALTPEIRRVAELLSGRAALLIGGLRRPSAQCLLQSSFQLDHLIWIATKEHQSIRAFEPYVARPEVAVVLLAIRWSSHSFGDVKQYCDRHCKPLARLPGGYNPAQVAAQILAQCGDSLSRA